MKNYIRENVLKLLIIKVLKLEECPTLHDE